MGTTVKKELKMKWQTDAGNDVGINLEDPLDNLESETVSTAMDEIIAQNVLQDSAGNAASMSVTASIVETTVEEKILF